MIRPGSDNSDPLQDGSCEDLGFHSIEYEDYKVEFECISKQKGRYIFLACLNVTKPIYTVTYTDPCFIFIHLT